MNRVGVLMVKDKAILISLARDDGEFASLIRVRLKNVASGEES